MEEIQRLFVSHTEKIYVGKSKAKQVTNICPIIACITTPKPEIKSKRYSTQTMRILT